MKGKCDVCGEYGEVLVANSAVGPVSFAYCQECATTGREPYGALVAGLMHASSMEDIPDWLRSTVTATLWAEGKTEEVFFVDTENAREEYKRAMARRGYRL